MSKETEINKLRNSVQNVLTGTIKDLQLIPVVAVKLLKLTSDENSDIKDLTKVIETEPVLASQVLKTVNSAQFNFPQPISSIQRAVAILGFSSIRNTALKLLLYNRLIARSKGQKFDLLFFWQHSLFVATLSRAIAIKLKHSDPDQIYCAGLLHDIGKLVLETFGKKNYSDFIASIEETSLSAISELELTFFGVTHEQVGHIFSIDFKLPELITSIIANHNPEQNEADILTGFEQENAIVAFANYLATIQGIGSFYQENPSQLSQKIIHTIDISSLDLKTIIDQVDKEMHSVSEFYGVRFPSFSELRAKLIYSSLKLCSSSDNSPIDSKLIEKEISLLTNLTIPHQSLDPEHFVPETLKAIHESFDLDRVFMLSMYPNRSLVTHHCWPQNLCNENHQKFEIKLDTLTGDLLTCLRTRKPAIISAQHFKNRSLLNQVGVSEFIAVPILRNKRLCALLYADNKETQKAIKNEVLSKIEPITKELGSALYNSKCFELEKNRAEIDPLTGLSNKRMIKDFLETLFSQKNRQLTRVCVGFLDIDHFKKLNDQCGHQRGDEALKIVADILRSLTRTGDFVGRYGGEEFVFILPNCIPSEAKNYAERIRFEIESQGVQLSSQFKGNKLTASIGIAMYRPKHSTYSELITAADTAMYKAKNSGRNKIVSI